MTMPQMPQMPDDFMAALTPTAAPLPEPVSVPFEQAFDGWISGASISKRSVPIYGRPDLYAEYQELERRHAVAEAEVEHGAVEMGSNPVIRIEAEMASLHDVWMQSRTLWTVSAVSAEQVRALRLQDPELVEPTQPIEPPPLARIPDNASPATHAAAAQIRAAAVAEYQAAVKAHSAAAEAFNAELALRVIATAVERIEYATGEVQDTVTVDQLRRLKTALGVRQILALSQAATLASVSEPEIPAPFSRANSSDGQTS